ncbi:hypothetical protein GCM10009647_088240 [Streptomyces sanglieri]
MPNASSPAPAARSPISKLVTLLRREGADAVCKGRSWGLPLEDRALLVTAYWRTNVTMRQIAPLSGISKSAAHRIIAHLGECQVLGSSSWGQT